MGLPVKILYIRADHEIFYILLFDGAVVKSVLPLETALSMLDQETFDLILSVPQNLLVYTDDESMEGKTPESFLPDFTRYHQNFRIISSLN
jgi:hypothetical protein